MFVASTCPAGSQYCDNPDHKLSPILPFGAYVGFARNGLTQFDDRPVTQWIWGYLVLQLTSIMSLGSSIRISLAPRVCWDMLEIWTPNSSLLTTGYFNPSIGLLHPRYKGRRYYFASFPLSMLRFTHIVSSMYPI